MPTALTNRMPSPQFTVKFQQQTDPGRLDQAGSSSSASRSCEPARENEVNYSQAKHHSVARFIAHQDFNTFKAQYTTALENIASFVRNSGGKIKPPLSEKAMQSVEKNFALLQRRLFDNDGSAFNALGDASRMDRRPLVYRQMKEAFHELSRLLENEKFSLHDRINAVVQLAPRLGLCVDGIGTDIEQTIRQLSKSTAGIKGAAHKWKTKLAEAAILEHVKRQHPHVDVGYEVHYVTAYSNYLAPKLGLAQRNDIVAENLPVRITAADLSLCSERVFSTMKPMNAVSDMANEYLGQIQNFLHEEHIDPNNISHDDIKKLQTFQEDNLDAQYDSVVPQVFLKQKDPEDYGSPQVYAGNEWPSGIKLHFMKELKKEGFVDYSQSKIVLGRTEDGHIKLILGKTDTDATDMRENILWAKEKGSQPGEPTVQSWAQTPPQTLFDAIEESAPESKQSLMNYLVGHLRHLPQNEVQEKEVDAILGTWMTHAVSKGKGGLLRVCLQAGIDKNCMDREGRTALMNAARTGQIGILNFMLKAGAYPDAKDHSGQTAMMHAAGKGHVVALQMLIKAGARVDTVDNAGRTAQTHAAELAANRGNGGAATLSTFIAASTSKNQGPWSRLFGDRSLDEKQKINLTAMINIVQRADIDAMKALIDQGMEIDAKNAQGETPAMLATRKNHAGMLQALFDNGADFDVQDKNGHTPAMFAAINNHVDALQTLIVNGADMEKRHKDGYTALMFAALNGHVDAAELLIENNANINVRSREASLAKRAIVGWGTHICATPLTLAILNGHQGVVEVLLKNGVDPNIPDGGVTGGMTPLMLAAMSGKVDAMRALLHGRVNINAEYTNFGSAAPLTALGMAIAARHYDTVRFLLDAGADVRTLQLSSTHFEYMPHELRDRIMQMMPQQQDPARR